MPFCFRVKIRTGQTNGQTDWHVPYCGLLEWHIITMTEMIIIPALRQRTA